MNIYQLNEFKRGWFIGDFEPSLWKTCLFEVAVQHYKAGEVGDVHYHKLATEYNVLVSGEIIIQDKKITAGQVFTLLPNEIADCKFLSDSIIVVVKAPSIPGDKYEPIP